MKTNYHTHHGICGHAYGTAEMYIQEAIDKNVNILGFSDHSPSTRIEDIGFRMTPEDLDSYINDIAQAREQYKNQITVYTGLEIEYEQNKEDYFSYLQSKVEYFVLGQHYIYMTEYDDMISTYEFTTKEEIYKYCETVKTALKELPITIFAHPDLYLFNYHTWDEYAQTVAKEICEVARETNTYLEFNANALRGTKIHTEYGEIYPYPRMEFFEIVKEYQIPVVVSSDCHKPSHLYDESMEQAVKMAMKLGLNIVKEITLKKMKYPRL